MADWVETILTWQELNAGHPATAIYLKVIPDSVDIGTFTYISKYGSLSVHVFVPHNHSLHPLLYNTTQLQNKWSCSEVTDGIAVLSFSKNQVYTRFTLNFFILWELKY